MEWTISHVAFVVGGPAAICVTVMVLVVRSNGGREATTFLRRQGADLPRLPGRLRGLAADPRTPRRARWPLIALAVYLVNPIDLVPDMIPVLGQLDDIAVAALLLWLAWRAVPPAIWREHLGPGPGDGAADRGGAPG